MTNITKIIPPLYGIAFYRSLTTKAEADEIRQHIESELAAEEEARRNVDTELSGIQEGYQEETAGAEEAAGEREVSIYSGAN